jgi:hypothetical protein
VDPSRQPLGAVDIPGRLQGDVGAVVHGHLGGVVAIDRDGHDDAAAVELQKLLGAVASRN